MPKPNKGERKDHFINRCMGNPESNTDFPSTAQRFAFCSSTWERSRKAMDNQVQAILCEAEKFESAEEASVWVRSQGFSADLLDERGDFFHFTQLPLETFQEGSFETIKFADGAAMIFGEPTPESFRRIRKGFDPSKPVGDATLGEYRDVLHDKKDPIFLNDMVKYLSCEYHEMAKVVQGIPSYRSNLFRYTLLKGLTPQQLEKFEIKSYGGWADDRRVPPEYLTFSTGPGKESMEGLLSGVIFTTERSGDHPLILEVDTSWGGGLHLSCFGKEKSHCTDFFEQTSQFMEENNYLRGKKLYADGSFIRTPKTQWDDLVLLDGFREKLEKHVINYVTRMEEMKKRGLPTKRGLLLYGPPGNGKTMLGKVIANNVDCTFIWVPYNMDASYTEVFQMARDLSPSVVFLEDLVSHGGMDRRASATSGSLGMLLNLLDGVEENNDVVTIATENFVNLLDSALSNRPGRFDVIMKIDNPDEDQRKRLLKRLLPDIAQHRINNLAAKSNKYSCAHIKELANRIIIEDELPEMDDVIIQDISSTFRIRN